jgi:hypothetical protein
MTNPLDLQDLPEDAPKFGGPSPDGCISWFSVSITGAGT